jgi:hypothetical protein
VSSLRYFVLVVKRNQPRLHAALRALPWKKCTTVRYDRETGHGPANMATLRNLAVNTQRDAGHRSIAAGLRQASYQPFTRPLDLLGLT